MKHITPRSYSHGSKNTHTYSTALSSHSHTTEIHISQSETEHIIRMIVMYSNVEIHRAVSSFPINILNADLCGRACFRVESYWVLGPVSTNLQHIYLVDER